MSIIFILLYLEFTWEENNCGLSNWNVEQKNSSPSTNNMNYYYYYYYKYHQNYISACPLLIKHLPHVIMPTNFINGQDI